MHTYIHVPYVYEHKYVYIGFYFAKYRQRTKKLVVSATGAAECNSCFLFWHKVEENRDSLSSFMQKTPRIHTHKRHVHFQEQDGRLPGSRPSSAPAEPNAKAARKASKKMEKEARWVCYENYMK